MVDVLGLILEVSVTGAHVQDRDGAQAVLGGLKDRFPRLQRVWADGAYAGKLVEWAQESAQLILDIVRQPKGQVGQTGRVGKNYTLSARTMRAASDAAWRVRTCPVRCGYVRLEPTQ